MALQSKLFKNDPKLEACLVNDSAHVTLGTVGNHVSKIQTALLILENANIAPNELVTSKYGTSTAAAVLAFKRKRNIVNRTYQNQADNIVGKMTIAALDKEMLANDSSQDDSGRIHCDSFPHPATRSGAILSFAVSGSAVSSVTQPAAAATPRSQALGRIMGATIWVASALNSIRLREAQLLSGNPDSEFTSSEARKALNTHFKLDQHPKPFDHLTFLQKVYQRILLTLALADSIFIDDPTTGDFANAFLGGFHEPSHPQHGRIRFGPAYLNKGVLFQTSVIVHEAAHFVDHKIDHFASELPAPNGTPVGQGKTKNYVQLTPFEAANNAYTFAQFALHCFMGFDKRIVPFNE